MATSYGLGQCRYNSNSPYISLLYNSNDYSNNLNSEYAIQYYTKQSSSYRDLCIKFPTIDVSINGETHSEPMVSYGKTYYLKLKIPQNPSYETDLLFKLCDKTSNEEINISRYQVINRFVIPPTPTTDDDFCDVILYEYPEDEPTKVQILTNKHKTDSALYADMDWNNDNWSTKLKDSAIVGEVYRKPNSFINVETETGYYYYAGNGNFIPIRHITKYSLIESWKINQDDTTGQTFVEFDFVFTPKFNLDTGFPFLYIEIQRNNSAVQDSINYTDTTLDPTGSQVYTGTYIDKLKTSVELYQINNILDSADGLSQIASGSVPLNHIAITGHPNQIFAINGEEIRLSPNGFYELDDYDITFLGAVAASAENRFIIDYEYKITT